MLLVPVDAAVLMEATSPRTSARCRGSSPAARSAGRAKWLSERNGRPNEPALLLLCPVKCESYFADNGGRRDESEKLLSRVRKVYAD